MDFAWLPQPTLQPQDLHPVDGAVLSTPAGECFVAERAFPLEHRHGHGTLGEALAVAPRALALLAREPDAAHLDLRDALFLDTETTGLSGGTGTYAFLVGVGRFEGERFVVRQYFMRDYSEEPALLHVLGELFPTARAFVTFNGRAFDWPLLETRFLMARTRPRLRLLAHVDLLFPSRRLWRGRLENCALGTLERTVLGHTRRDDIPGWAIPSVYFDFVRYGGLGPMRRVFAHNLDDILSLAALLGRLGRLVGSPLETPCDPADLLAVARLHEDGGLGDAAIPCYERALTLPASPVLRRELLTRLAALHKRRGELERALELWRLLVAAGLDDVAPLVELAKHLEHRERDLEAAIDLVQQALVVLELRALRQEARDRAARGELERRLARLLRKAAARRSQDAAT